MIMAALFSPTLYTAYLNEYPLRAVVSDSLLSLCPVDQVHGPQQRHVVDVRRYFRVPRVSLAVRLRFFSQRLQILNPERQRVYPVRSVDSTEFGQEFFFFFVYQF